MLYPLDNGAPRTVPKPADGFAPLRWCPDNRSLMRGFGRCATGLPPSLS